MNLLWVILLLVAPLWVLRLNNLLQPYTDVSLPYIGKIPSRLRLFINLYQYHPRVLDAWVRSHLAPAPERFALKNTVRERQAASPLPPGMDGKTGGQLCGSRSL